MLSPGKLSSPNKKVLCGFLRLWPDVGTWNFHPAISPRFNHLLTPRPACPPIPPTRAHPKPSPCNVRGWLSGFREGDAFNLKSANLREIRPSLSIGQNESESGDHVNFAEGMPPRCSGMPMPQRSNARASGHPAHPSAQPTATIHQPERSLVVNCPCRVTIPHFSRSETAENRRAVRTDRAEPCTIVYK